MAFKSMDGSLNSIDSWFQTNLPTMRVCYQTHSSTQRKVWLTTQDDTSTRELQIPGAVFSVHTVYLPAEGLIGKSCCI